MEKQDILKEIRELERRLSMRREAASHWMRMIELTKHDVNTFTPDPWEHDTIESHIEELKEAKDSFTRACQDIHEMKQCRNFLQKKQSQL